MSTATFRPMPTKKEIAAARRNIVGHKKFDAWFAKRVLLAAMDPGPVIVRPESMSRTERRALTRKDGVDRRLKGDVNHDGPYAALRATYKRRDSFAFVRVPADDSATR